TNRFRGCFLSSLSLSLSLPLIHLSFSLTHTLDHDGQLELTLVVLMMAEMTPNLPLLPPYGRPFVMSILPSLPHFFPSLVGSNSEAIIGNLRFKPDDDARLIGGIRAQPLLQWNPTGRAVVVGFDPLPSLQRDEGVCQLSGEQQ